VKSRRFKAPSGATINFTERGFGAAPLGNHYKAVNRNDAQMTLEAAWEAGIRYYDTAPLYGLDLSETPHIFPRLLHIEKCKAFVFPAFAK
jgi:D-threo-aldose 1-dehydrogenase